MTQCSHTAAVATSCLGSGTCCTGILSRTPAGAERLPCLQATEEQESAKLRQAEREAAEEAAAADDNTKLLKAENVQVSSCT